MVVCIGHCGSQFTRHSTGIDLASLQLCLGYCGMALNSIPMVDVSLLWRAFCSGFTGITYITCGTAESLAVGFGVFFSRLIFAFVCGVLEQRGVRIYI